MKMPIGSPYYVLDRGLDDSERWTVSEATCHNTGEDFILVWRTDREPLCPICHSGNPRLTLMDPTANILATIAKAVRA